MAPAQFTGTTVLLSEARHQGSPVLLFGYQNTAQSEAVGPNAMLLHIPARDFSQANMISAALGTYVLDDMVEALTPRSRTMRYGRSMAPSKSAFQIFEHDIYTVVVARNASDIPDALSFVPAGRRPTLNKPLFDFYARTQPHCMFMLLCFNNRDAKRAKPVLCWYEPYRTDQLMLPGIDCHTGGVPNLDAHVIVDHWVIVGTQRHLPGFTAVDYRDPLDATLTQFLPSHVAGAHFAGSMQNGDFLLAPIAQGFYFRRGLLN